ncbi:hypothetical protein ACUXST_000142 [Sphingomonas sp. F9_3S_D5_B_2]
MTEKWHEHEPTDEQVAQTKRVETALCNEINLLAREGIPVACILSGLGVTVADLLTCRAGPESVAPWFAAQAEMLARIIKPS